MVDEVMVYSKSRMLFLKHFIGSLVLSYRGIARYGLGLDGRMNFI